VDERTRQEFAASYPDWDMSETAISRTFRFGDFVEAVRFVVGVSLLAERADHHPDIDIRWNRVTLTLSTHSEGGLTDKDLALAEQIETRLL
jgi:4a-hydroxytetrahydrobiopterin dehydratase